MTRCKHCRASSGTHSDGCKVRLMSQAAALDYLLKPFTDERFEVAMQRVRDTLERSRTTALGEQFRQVLAATEGGARTLERFTVKTERSLKVFHVDEIDWIEADEYYCKLHIGGDIHMIRQPIGMFEERLPAKRFARIHRSTIVNLERVAELEPLFQGDCNVILRDGTRLRMSRRRREALADIMSSFS
jgi:two-component system LytT family response regulator